MDLGPHADFIVGAYVVAAAIVVALIGWVMLDRRRQMRILFDLEQRGVTRRSDGEKRSPDEASGSERNPGAPSPRR